jgi:hypothetical protein
MASLTPETAKQLYDSGHISEDTFNLISGNSSKVPTEETAPESKALQIEPVAPEKELAITPATTEEIEGRTPAATQNASQVSPQVTEQQPKESSTPVLASEANAKQQSPANALGLSLEGMGKSIDDSYKMMQDASVAGAAAGIKAANAESSYLNQTALKLQEQEQQRVQHEAVRQQALKEKTDKLESMISEFDSKKVDAGHFWGSRSTEQKLSIGIGMFLGAFGGPGGNAAVQVVEDAIKRDIDIQKTDLEKGKTKIGMQQNLLGQMREQFGDERQAEAAAKLAMLQQAEMKTRAIAAQYKSPQIQAQAQEAYAKYELAKQQARLDFVKSAQTSPAFMQMDGIARKIQSMPENVRGEAWKELGDYQNHQKTLESVRNAMHDIYKYSRLGEKISPASQQRLEAARSTLLTYTKEMFGGKSDIEFEIMHGLAPDSLKDNDDTFEDKLAKVVKRFNTQASFPRLQAFGALPKELDLGAPVK